MQFLQACFFFNKPICCASSIICCVMSSTIATRGNDKCLSLTLENKIALMWDYFYAIQNHLFWDKNKPWTMKGSYLVKILKLYKICYRNVFTLLKVSSSIRSANFKDITYHFIQCIVSFFMFLFVSFDKAKHVHRTLFQPFYCNLINTIWKIMRGKRNRVEWLLVLMLQPRLWLDSLGCLWLMTDVVVGSCLKWADSTDFVTAKAKAPQI